jgi:predicted ATPase
VQNILLHYEAYLLQLTIGDKGSYLYATFGAPQAHDDDIDRAVAAALELQSPPPTLNFISPAQIGLSQGRTRVGAYGGTERRTYGVLGDEVNLAARLMTRARPGQILISQRIAQVVAPRYRLEHLGSIRVKGKQQALPTWLVLGRRFASLQRPAQTIFTQPMVGREEEVARLVQLLAAAQVGKGYLLRLVGPPGVGKSRLAAEFIEQAIQRNFQVALGACQSASQETTYYPWRHIFRTLFELTDEPAAGEETADWTARQISQIEARLITFNFDWRARLPLLGDLLGLPIADNATTATFEPQLRQEALFTMIVDLLRAWTRLQPLLLVIEDAHWLDETSLELTLALARIIAEVPLALTLVYRPPTAVDEPRPLFAGLSQLPDHRLMDLSELSPAGVALLVANRLQGQISAVALSLIQTQVQGNPFFSEELVDTLRERGDLYRQASGRWTLSERLLASLRQANCLDKDAGSGEWVLVEDAPLAAAHLGLPDSIYGMVLSRIDLLPEPHKVTMKVASVIGRIFEFELLSQAHPGRPSQAELLEQITLLEQRDFIRLEAPEGRPIYMFKHNITQEVAYDTLLEDQQRQLHRALGENLEIMQPEAVERLAYHYSRSGVRAKAIRYLEKAAGKAQHEYANETALYYYNQALALAPRWTWLKEKVRILHILGRREEEQVELAILSASANAPLYETTYLWGRYYEALGDYTQAQTAIEQALAANQASRNLVGEVRCLAHLGLIARRQGDYNGAKAWYQQALALFPGETSYSDEAARSLIQILNGLGTVHRQQSEFDQATLYYQQALALSRQGGNRLGEAEALNNLGVTAYYQRRLTETQAYHRQALEIRRAIGARASEGMSLYNLALIIQEAGNYNQAQEYFLAALAIQQATGNRWEEINVWIGLGILNQELGDLPAAQTCLQQALMLSQKIGDEAGQAYVLCNLGLVMADRGDLEAAEKLLSDGLALTRTQADRDLESGFLSYLSMVSLQKGHLQQAIEQAEAAIIIQQELDQRLRMTDNLATLASAYLAANNLTSALDYAQQTLALLEECGGEGPEFPQRDYFICFQILAATGQVKPAQTALQSAYELVMARANKITDPALRQSFLERVVVNREIVAEYEQRRTEKDGA